METKEGMIKPPFDAFDKFKSYHAFDKFKRKSYSCKRDRKLDGVFSLLFILSFAKKLNKYFRNEISFFGRASAIHF